MVLGARWGWLSAVGVAASLGSAGCDSTEESGTAQDGSSTSADSAGTTGGSDPMPPATMSTSATSGQPSASTTASATSGPGPAPTTTATTATTEDSESEVTGPPAEGWLEVGYGLDEFFAFEETLPVYTGPQGFYMFSLPLRGSDFPVAPDPLDFNHPDAPILAIWADVEGIDGPHPSGHFSVYLDYPVGFSVSLDSEADYEFVAVWLVTPDAYPPEDLIGRTATIHAELECADGQLLVDEHELVIIDGAI